MKWRRNYSNLSTEIIGVDTCQQWKQFLSKLKYLEIFLKFQIMQIPFLWDTGTVALIAGLPASCKLHL